MAPGREAGPSASEGGSGSTQEAVTGDVERGQAGRHPISPKQTKYQGKKVWCFVLLQQDRIPELGWEMNHKPTKFTEGFGSFHAHL